MPLKRRKWLHTLKSDLLSVLFSHIFFFLGRKKRCLLRHGVMFSILSRWIAEKRKKKKNSQKKKKKYSLS